MNLSRNIGQDLTVDYDQDSKMILIQAHGGSTYFLNDETFHALCKYRAWLQTELASRQAMGEPK